MKTFSIPEHALTLGQDLQVAVDAAVAAGRIISENYSRLIDIEEKGVGDLVSFVDRACDEAVQNVLRNVFPDDGVLSEELSSDTVENGERLWVIDPLDGTAGFLFQVDERISSVMIALRKNMRTVVSVVLFPLVNELYYAKSGEGAFLNGRRLTTDHVATDLSKAWVDMNHYGDFHHQSKEFTVLDERLRSEDGARLVTRFAPHSGIFSRIVRPSSRLAAVVHDNGSKVKQGPWDIIPAQLILEEAGGVMLNMEGERVDPFVQEPFIAAGNRKIADSIRSLLFSG